MHPQQFWLEFSLEKRNSGISLLLFGSFCAFHCSVRSEQDVEQFHSIFCSVLQDLAIRNGIILENHNCSAYTVKPSQNAINGIQESNFDVRVTVGGRGTCRGMWVTLRGRGLVDMMSHSSPSGSSEGLYCPESSWTGCGLASAGGGCPSNWNIGGDSSGFCSWLGLPGQRQQFQESTTQLAAISLAWLGERDWTGRRPGIKELTCRVTAPQPASPSSVLPKRRTRTSAALLEDRKLCGGQASISSGIISWWHIPL